MIILWVYNIAMNILGWLLSLMPPADLSFLSEIGTLHNIFGALGRANNAVPVTEIAAAFGIYGVAYLALHGGNLIRRVVSLFTGGGGS